MLLPCTSLKNSGSGSEGEREEIGKEEEGETGEGGSGRRMEMERREEGEGGRGKGEGGREGEQWELHVDGVVMSQTNAGNVTVKSPNRKTKFRF